MTWLIWRQHRYEILAMLVGAAFIAIGLVYGADYVPRVRAELGVDTCVPLPTTAANCAILSTRASDLIQPFRWLVLSLFFVPAVVGSFIGGPLFARDLERGTHRLVWTQGITRMRWSVAKLLSILAVGAVAAAVVASVGGRASVINGVQTYTFEQSVSLYLAAPASVVTNPFQTFDFEGPAFVGYVVFALAIAAFVGTLSRRILVGMFAGLLLFGVARLGIYELRPTYEPPIAVVYSAQTPFPQAQVSPGAWVTSVDYLDADGQVVPQDRVRALLNAYRPAPPRFDTLAYMAENGAYQRVRYQPADRYWRFQWTEGLLFFALAVGLGAMTLTLLRRRDA
jgi:hypothetical protein